MKKLLLSIALLASGMISGTAYSQLTRELPNDGPSGPNQTKVCAHVDAALLSRMRSVNSSGTESRFPMLDKNVKPKKVAKHSRENAPAKAGALKGSSFRGFITWTSSYASDLGWYSYSPSSISKVWAKQSVMTTPHGGGFVRDGKLYAFAHVATTEGVTDSGMYLLEEASGEAIGTLNFDLFDGADKVVMRAVYDPESDVAYAVTYNKSGNGYILQKFNPVTYEFTDLGVSVPNDWIAFAWSPADKTVYMLDESCSLKKYDSKQKKFVAVKSYSYDNDTYVTAMTYSPKDKGFLAFVPTWDANDNEVFDAVVFMLDGTYTKIATLDDQWSILECFDSYVNEAAPKAVAVNSVNITGPALTGTISVTLPSQYENGNPLTGTVYLEATLDGTKLSGMPSGAAGSQVSVSISAEEGLHRIILTPYVLTEDGKLYGTQQIIDRYFGYDTPNAPASVTLTASKVNWKPVTTGKNGGYVDASAIKYNVYLDGVKLNAEPVSGTTYSVSITGASSAGHVAEVEAVAGEKVSERTASEKYYGSGAMSIPVNISADSSTGDIDETMKMMFSIQKDPLNNEDLRGWRYDDQNEHTGGFYVLCPKATSRPDGKSDEWLFLPPISFENKNALYRFTMDVWSGNHYFTSPEYYEVTLSRNPTSEGAIVIRPEDVVSKKPAFETSETMFEVPEAGVWYIGIHYTSPLDSYRLYARNFRVEKAEATAGAPGAVTELVAEAAARGELKAHLTFRMPEMSVTDAALASDEVITATASSEAGEVSVTGAPGEEMTLAVPTKQGDNLVRVVTSSANGEGMQAETTVYTGVYAPGTPVVFQTASDDNCTLILNIELPEKNEYGKYAGTEGDVVIYRKISGEWRPFENIGAARTWSYDVPDHNKQDLYQFGVGAYNAAGYCEVMNTFGVHLGRLYTLPMTENFGLSGNDVIVNCEPLSTEYFSEYPAQWGFCDPSDFEDEYANASGVAIYATWEADTQLTLPRFSTKGAKNAKAEFSIHFGDITPSFISIYGCSPSMDYQLIEQFTPASGSGWERKLVSLPAECQDQGWVQLAVRCDIVGYSQYFLMDGYNVKDYPEDMITISSTSGNSRAVVGEPTEIGIEIENSGIRNADMPEYVMTLIGDNGVIGNLTAQNLPETLLAGEKYTLSFIYTPKAADMGNVLARFTLPGQPAQSVSEMDKTIEVMNAPLARVDDLVAEVTGKREVTLSWSEARNVESFEAADIWHYGDKIRGFRNIDRDMNTVWSISEVSHPGKNMPKAYQVFVSDGVDNPLLNARTGSQYLLGMSSRRGATDDWLISPEVKGGSEISFWLDVLDPQYPETIYVMYSVSGDNPDDFVQLENGEVTPDTRQWAKYSYLLPANAKYFALWHNGYNGEDQFGLRIDDIAYEAANPTVAFDGYNVYRDGELILTATKNTGYVDTDVDVSSPVQYVVRTTGIVNGERVESEKSNSVWVHDETGVETISTLKGIYSGKGEIILKGYAGEEVAVNDAAGCMIFRGVVASDTTTLKAQSGVYVVKCGNKAAKLIVK